MLDSRRVLSVAAFAVTATLLTGGPAFAATTYSWFFNTVVVGSPLTGGQVFHESTGTTPLNAADTTTLAGAALDTSHQQSVYFPGWQGVAAGGTVSATASMLSSDANFESSGIGGSDGGADLQDPGLGNFTVSIWVKPDNPAGFNVIPGDQLSTVSPNVVQKGLSGTPGGFWKLSLGLAQTGTTRYWYPFCEFKNGATNDLKPGHNTAKFQMTAGTAYKVECVKIGAVATVNVYTGSGPAVFTDSSPAMANFSISNTSALSVGHKPTSTDPRDVYAGVIDNLNIAKG